MQTNLWNLKNSKERLGIREKTQAHKRHLISVVKAKSRVDDRNKQWRVKSLNAGYSQRAKQNIQKDNKEIVDRLYEIEKNSGSRVNSSQSKNGRKFISITQNLRSMASIHRFNRIRKIQDENAKFFNRLISTTPTLSRQEWIKGIRDNKKYKVNMSRTKYFQPDYSYQVNKNTSSRKVTYRHLKISKCTQELPNLSVRVKNIR